MPGEEAAGEVDVFGRDPHFPVVPQAERGGDVVEIRHAAHVDPRLRHRDRDVSLAEAELRQQHDARFGVRDHLAHEVFAGDAEMRGALGELHRDLRSGQIGDFHAGDLAERAAILAPAARLDELEAGAAKERPRVLLQPPLGRNREHEGAAHALAPIACSRPIHTAKPTAGIAFSAPSRDKSPS